MSIKAAVFLEKFKRVAYLKQKNFDEFEIALTVGISVTATNIFCQLYKDFRHKAFFKQRLREIDLVGGQYYHSQDEKKRIASLKESTEKGWN